MKSWEPWGGAEQAPGAVSLQEGFPELEPGERMSGIGRAGRGGVARSGPRRGLQSLQGSLGEAPWVSVL